MFPTMPIATLLRRRVPLYISLPVVLACGAAGYVASTWQPVDTARLQSPPAGKGGQGSAATPIRAPAVAETQLSSAIMPPNGASTAGQRDEADPLSPARRAANVVQRNEQVPSSLDEAAPSAAAITETEPHPHATRRARSASQGHGSPRTAQRRLSAPQTAGGLKGIPIIGPVFTLLQ